MLFSWGDTALVLRCCQPTDIWMTLFPLHLLLKLQTSLYPIGLIVKFGGRKGVSGSANEFKDQKFSCTKRTAAGGMARRNVCVESRAVCSFGFQGYYLQSSLNTKIQKWWLLKCELDFCPYLNWSWFHAVYLSEDSYKLINFQNIILWVFSCCQQSIGETTSISPIFKAIKLCVCVRFIWCYSHYYKATAEEVLFTFAGHFPSLVWKKKSSF